jgi:hypothetical protein
MDMLIIDPLFRVGKVLLDEWLPLFLCNRTERVMATGPVKRTVLIQDHLLDQMFAATEKNVAHPPMLLDYASQLPLHTIAAVFEDLLKFVDHYCNLWPIFCRDARGCLQNFLEDWFDPSILGQAEAEAGLSFLVD